jgi:hypothetical protein
MYSYMDVGLANQYYKHTQSTFQLNLITRGSERGRENKWQSISQCELMSGTVDKGLRQMPGDGSIFIFVTTLRPFFALRHDVTCFPAQFIFTVPH